MPVRAPARLLAAWLAACALAANGGAEEAAREPKIEKLGTLPPALAESSGVAASRTQPGVLWTHNDSGGGARLFALSAAGELRKVYYLIRGRAVDWEDIAVGACPAREGACLFVADTGDNLEDRRSVTVWILDEPQVPAGSTDAITSIAEVKTLRVRYADGPHDVEAIAFDPDGNLLLISKGQRSPIRVYRVDRAKLSNEEAGADLVDLDTIAPRAWLGGWITGAALSPAKTRLVVRTYTELYFYRFGAKGELVPDGPPCELGFVEPQGEGVDFLDEDTLVLTSESRGGRNGELLRVRCPRGG